MACMPDNDLYARQCFVCQTMIYLSIQRVVCDVRSMRSPADQARQCKSRGERRSVHDPRYQFQVRGSHSLKTKEGWDRKGTGRKRHFTCFSTKGLSKKNPITAEGRSTRVVNVLYATGELGLTYRAFHGMITREDAGHNFTLLFARLH